MKKWLLIVVPLAIVSAGSALFLSGPRENWTLETASGTGLVLSLKGTSETIRPATLQIRCDGASAELRLYVPIRVTPPAGRSGGAATLNMSEEFRSRDRQIVAASAGADEPFGWIVADDGTYAARTDAAAFIRGMLGRDFLYLRILGLGSSSRITPSTIVFPVRGLTDYKDRVVASCRDSAK